MVNSTQPSRSCSKFYSSCHTTLHVLLGILEEEEEDKENKRKWDVEGMLSRENRFAKEKRKENGAEYIWMQNLLHKKMLTRVE